MLRIRYLVIRVAVQPVRKEPNGLHVTQQSAAIGQQLLSHVRQLRILRQITAGIGLERLHVHMFIVEIRLILLACIRRRSHKIAKIA